MSYNTQAQLANDSDVLTRVAACAATQTPIIPQPQSWAWERQWQFATRAGWAEKYKAAVTAGNERPGYDESVITDSMILTAVQAIILAKT